jgi:protein-disulfide isomerase
MSPLTPPVTAADHVDGPDTAPLTLLEYGDYECPYCGMAYLILKATRRALGSQLRFVFRNFPLGQIHLHAKQAAQAAEAAAAQGKFWEMHDALFENQNALEEADLLRYAKMLGLDTERVARELEAKTYVKRVRDDFRSGVRSGANKTPSFFINGERYDGPWEDVDAFTRVLRDAADQASRHAPVTAEA